MKEKGTLIHVGGNINYRNQMETPQTTKNRLTL
jgi:hypothetical protein